LANTVPYVEFVFSWEGRLQYNEGCTAFCYYQPCPRCRTCFIEIYLDRLLSLELIQCIERFPFGKDPDNDRLYHTLFQIDTNLLHELAHWAGCTDEQAYSVEELRYEFTTTAEEAAHRQTRS
jgi:hypothetical protein